MSTLVKWNALGMTQNFAPAADTAEVRTIDVDAAAALSIGQTLATSVAIAKAGVMTTMAGGATLTNTGLTMTGLNIGSAIAEIGEIFIAKDKYIKFGDGQEGTLGYVSATTKMAANAISWDFGACTPFNVPANTNFSIGGAALAAATVWTAVAANIVFGNGTGNADPYHTHTAAELTQTFTNGEADNLVAGSLVYQKDAAVQTALRASSAALASHAWQLAGIVKTTTATTLPTPVYTYPGTTNVVLTDDAAGTAWVVGDCGKPAYLDAAGHEGKATKTLPVAGVVMEAGVIIDGVNHIILYQPAYRGAF